MSADSFLDIGFDPIDDILKNIKPLASLQGSLKHGSNPVYGKIMNINNSAANKSDFNHEPIKLFKPEVKKPNFGM